MSWQGTRLSQFTFEVLQSATVLQRKIISEFLQGVVLASPVDTGAFRGNNLVSIGSVDVRYDLNKVDKVGGQTIAEGNMRILQAKIGDLVYVQNNLPYSVALENGYSQQAPTGIYALTFQRVTSKYK
ncbi:MULTISPECIES: hypothetical protein [Acinetobacter]|uniref:HK97 gp10 family phage protein n=1 Tax=Acinetobacter piscicola TaxID=2006115 RepID=A0A4Q4GVS5_9GAMM|nr:MULTISPECIES: hypothetical protein [Acinetobacter]MDM1760697.1 hypothetical protein [Acinetobacter sp. 251-1]QOW45786.1 hypothetical protein G0028_07700 [Acinetobacter piscicola]RYL22186.1 hypothetical protein EWP19_16985 [Acinetobacter piscicola]